MQNLGQPAKDSTPRSLTRYEMETIVSYNDEEREADVYTASKQVTRKLDKLCEQYPDTYRCVKRNPLQATYRCPKSHIRFGAPTSEARRQACRMNSGLAGVKPHQLVDENPVT